MISINAASKAFGDRVLWHDVNLTIDSGSMVALVGPSGSGKSTLLNCIGLLEPLDEGTISVDSEQISGRSAGFTRRFRRDRLGYLFQNYALIDSATVRQNLDVVLTTRQRLDRSKRELQAKALVEVGMGGREDDNVFTLSGGEQQRVALARLIVKQPDIVMADEPTGALDDTNASMVMTTLRDFAERGATVVVATHSDAVRTACDHVIDVRDFSPEATHHLAS